MTSLTAALLFNHPVQLPKGIKRLHRMDSAAEYQRQINDANAARAEATRLANVESVFALVASGVDTIGAIHDEVGLSITTVQKALIELENWIPPRVVRQRHGHGRHTFRVIE